MKTVYFLFITLFVVVDLSFAARRYSSYCQLHQNGDLIPDPDDCSHYYRCHNGRASRKHCAHGFYFDVDMKICNFPGLVDCRGNGDRNPINPVTEKEESTTECPSTTPPCSTTTTPCSTSTTPCSTTTTPCSTTTTSCSTTTTPCTTSTTPCTTSTSPCSTTTTPCSTTTTPCSTTTTPCSTSTTPCSTTTTPCSTTTTPCSTTTTACSTVKPTAVSVTEPPKEVPIPAHPLMSKGDCSLLTDGTYLYDTKHCRRFYVCVRGKPKRVKCRSGSWFDIEKLSCRNRKEVHNCKANCN